MKHKSTGTDPVSRRDHSPSGQALPGRAEHIQRLLHLENRVLEVVQPEREVQQRQVEGLHQPLLAHRGARDGLAQQ